MSQPDSNWSSQARLKTPVSVCKKHLRDVNERYDNHFRVKTDEVSIQNSSATVQCSTDTSERSVIAQPDWLLTEKPLGQAGLTGR